MARGPTRLRRIPTAKFYLPTLDIRRVSGCGRRLRELYSGRISQKIDGKRFGETHISKCSSGEKRGRQCKADFRGHRRPRERGLVTAFDESVSTQRTRKVGDIMRARHPVSRREARDQSGERAFDVMHNVMHKMTSPPRVV